MQIIACAVVVQSLFLAMSSSETRYTVEVSSSILRTSCAVRAVVVVVVHGRAVHAFLSRWELLHIADPSHCSIICFPCMRTPMIRSWPKAVVPRVSDARKRLTRIVCGSGRT